MTPSHKTQAQTMSGKVFRGRVGEKEEEKNGKQPKKMQKTMRGLQDQESKQRGTPFWKMPVRPQVSTPILS